MALPADGVPEGAEDLTNDGSLLKTILVEGDGEEAGRGAKVAVKYSLRLAEDDADPFDSSEKRKDGVLEFTLGRKKVIPALELVAQSMKLGEKCKAKAAAPYAFGAKGLKRKGVPPNSAVFLDVEMIHCEGGEKKKTLADMTPAERFEQAKQCKEAGNAFFKELKYEKAMGQYSQCIRYLSNVFYKPSSSLADSAAKPVSTASAETQVEGSQGANGRGGEGNVSKSVTDDAQNGPDEEGFEEAEVLENPLLSEARDSAGADVTEEAIETVDVSTVQEQKEESTLSAQSPARASSTPTGNGEAIASAEESRAEENADGGELSTGESKEVTLENDDPEEAEVVALHVTTLNNLSLCLVKLEDYKRAVESASLALRMDPDNSKALYYRGRAQIALGDWDKARTDLVAAAKIQPNNIGIRMEIQKLDKKKKLFEEKEKKQAAAMFA